MVHLSLDPHTLLHIFYFKHLRFYLGSWEVVRNDSVGPPHSQQPVVMETGEPGDFRAGERLQLVQVQATK